MSYPTSPTEVSFLVFIARVSRVFNASVYGTDSPVFHSARVFGVFQHLYYVLRAFSHLVHRLKYTPPHMKTIKHNHRSRFREIDQHSSSLQMLHIPGHLINTKPRANEDGRQTRIQVVDFFSTMLINFKNSISLSASQLTIPFRINEGVAPLALLINNYFPQKQRSSVPSVEIRNSLTSIALVPETSCIMHARKNSGCGK